jgi:hypothetical protein
VAVIKYKTADGYKTLEVPTVQRAVMPNIDDIPLGTIVQYTGATAGNFVNGYFYKAVESSEVVQVNYYGYTQGSGDYRTDLFSKEGQTEGYYYSSTTSASVMKSLPNFTPLDGNKYVKDGTTYNFEDAPNMAESRVYPFSSSSSTTMKLRIKNGSSYMENSNTVTLERKSSIDTTREETVVTKTWQQINVQPSSAGEAESYNDLADKPAINGHTLGGDQTSAQLGLMTPADIHVYSTTERLVGEWIDGSPVYERVFQLTNFTALNANTTYEFVKPVASYGIERLIDAMLIGDTFAVQDGKTPVYAIQHGISWYNKYDDVIKYTMQGAMGGSSTPLQHAYFIIRYTKVQS